MGPGECGKPKRQKREGSVPGCGGGAEGGKRSEALRLLRFGWVVWDGETGRKEEGTWGGVWGGQTPESWSLTVKCLEIPKKSGRRRERRRSRWSHTILPGRATTWPLWLDSPSTGLLWSRPESAMLPRRKVHTAAFTQQRVVPGSSSQEGLGHSRD